MTGKVEVRGVAESDLPDLARFYAAMNPVAPPAERGDPVAHLHWFLFENPAALSDTPPAWIGRDPDGRIVGAEHCVPQRFRCGEQGFTLLHGGGYYVDAAHRGLGMVLMRKYLSLSDRHSHFSTTMNAASGAIFERSGGYPIDGSDRELIGVLRWPALVEEVLARRLGGSALVRGVAAAAALRPAAVRGAPRGSLRPVASPEEVTDLALATPPEHAGVLTALRDPAFLRWRYFAGPDRTRELLVYEGPGGRCLVGVNRRPRGHRGQARALMVLDLWGAIPVADTADVARALAARHRDRSDLIVFRGLPEPRERALVSAGFVSRRLPRAAGVCIDRAGRLPTRRWYLVPADGDAGH
jgi:hypothetical protein